MYVYEKMTKNIATITPECSVSKAFQILTEERHSQLPVVNNENQVVGLVTEKLLAEVNPSKATSLSVYEINYLLSKTKVRDIMRTGIFKINQSKQIEDAALVMNENRIGFLPVVDDNERLVGVITRLDVIKAFMGILAVKEPGTRLSIKTENSINDIAEITGILKKHNIILNNIANIYKDGCSELLIKIKTLNTDSLIDELKSKNYNVTILSKQY